MPSGRKTTLTAEKIPIIERMVRTGQPWKQIAQWMGVAEGTIHQWRAKGAEAKSGIYREFVQRINAIQLETLAQCEDVILTSALEGATERTVKVHKRETVTPDGKTATVVHKEETTRHIPPNADMAFRWAERRFPETHGRRVTAKHEGHVDGSVTHAIDPIPGVKGVTLQMIYDDGAGEDRDDRGDLDDVEPDIER